MRARLEPSTWLFAGVAGWAVLCAGIALWGFGGGFRTLPMPAEEAAATDGKAVARKAARPAMGPLESYAEVYTRPLFYIDRKPIAVHIGGNPDAPAAQQQLDVTLTSIIMSPSLQMALVQDPKTKEVYRVRQGQALGGVYGSWKLTGLSPRSATFDNGGGDQTLELRVFDGKGGEEPTRMGLTPQAVAAGAAGSPRPGHPQVDVEVPPPPPPPDAVPQDAGQDPNGNEAAARAAAEAANQAELIRRRIEERRKQAQAQRAANNKER